MHVTNIWCHLLISKHSPSICNVAVVLGRPQRFIKENSCPLWHRGRKTTSSHVWNLPQTCWKTQQPFGLGCKLLHEHTIPIFKLHFPAGK